MSAIVDRLVSVALDLRSSAIPTIDAAFCQHRTAELLCLFHNFKKQLQLAAVTDVDYFFRLLLSLTMCHTTIPGVRNIIIR
jgi:hypothetical protein